MNVHQMKKKKTHKNKMLLYQTFYFSYITACIHINNTPRFYADALKRTVKLDPRAIFRRVLGSKYYSHFLSQQTDLLHNNRSLGNPKPLAHPSAQISLTKSLRYNIPKLLYYKLSYSIKIPGTVVKVVNS